MSRTKLSFVIPAYNEEDSIGTTLGTLDDVAKKKKLRYEIVVVDDGSRDKTLSKVIMYASKNGHVKVIGCPKNEGKGYAVKAGFMQATGNIVVFADSDMEVDLSMISRYVAALQHGDIVIASKWHPDSVVEMPLVRKILSHGFNILVRLLIGSPFKDTQAGLKAMKKSVFIHIFPRLTVKRYAFDVELLAVANLYGLKVVEMPVNLKIKRERALFSFREVWRMFVDLLGIMYRLKIRRCY